jgi:NAD(P)-dependent dehydrogenase (short-subunit alcohol dehydrogenase family)
MSDPVVLITGGLTGIGRAAAVAFAKKGANVVVAGRHDEAGKALVAAEWLDHPDFHQLFAASPNCERKRDLNSTPCKASPKHGPTLHWARRKSCHSPHDRLQATKINNAPI